MFSNPVYNLPPQFNENILTQNLAGLSLNSVVPPHQDPQQRQNLDFGSFQFAQQQQQQQQQQQPIELGGYAPPTLEEPNTKWPSPDDVNASYQRGSTVVRQYNNSIIDDYYKKFLRPITDYVAIPTNGQPTYVYQNLGGQGTSTTVGLAQQPVGAAETASDLNAAVPATSQPKAEGTEEKKHKKKHKKRSSKHAHEDGGKHGHSSKTADEQKTGVVDPSIHKEVPSIPARGGHEPQQQQQQQQQLQQQQQQQQVPPQQAAPAGGAGLTNTGAAGPQVPMRSPSNPVVFFDIEIDNEPRGRLIMELFRHVLPRTSQNFLALTTNEHGFGYRLSYFHRIIPGFMAQGGDFEKSNGTGGYSIYGEKFDDEGFPYPHDRPGLLSMANSGPNTNGSQFFITFEPCPHLDNKHVVYGQVLQGFHILKDLDMSGSESGEVLREVKIAATGQLQ